MLEPVFLHNAMLRARLRASLKGEIPGDRPNAPEPVPPVLPASNLPPLDTESIDVVVTMNEVNDKHGTGPLVKRVYRSPHRVFSIRTRDDWGVQDFGRWDIKLAHQSCCRPDWFRNVLAILAGRRISSVLCVPFLIDEIQTSIAIK